MPNALSLTPTMATANESSCSESGANDDKVADMVAAPTAREKQLFVVARRHIKYIEEWWMDFIRNGDDHDAGRLTETTDLLQTLILQHNR